MFADVLPLLFIAFGLSADCFAVALTSGVAGRDMTARNVLRVSVSFGLFQAVMPLLGWLVGTTAVELISEYDHWAAFVLLAFVGGKMLWDAFRVEHGRDKSVDIANGLTLLMLSAATSIDALAVGLSFAFTDANVALAIPAIGVVAFGVTAAGFSMGRRLGHMAGRWAELVGGIVLIGIAFKVLLDHLL